MILAAFAALVIHTYSHQDRVITDLDAAQCEVTRCAVLFGSQSCGAVLASGVKAELAQRKRDSEQAAWVKANPKIAAHCFPHHDGITYLLPDVASFCGPKYPYGKFGTVGMYVTTTPVDATQSAMCVRQRGDK